MEQILYLVGNDLAGETSQWINGYLATSAQDALTQHLATSEEAPTWVAEAPSAREWQMVRLVDKVTTSTYQLREVGG